MSSVSEQALRRKEKLARVNKMRQELQSMEPITDSFISMSLGARENIQVRNGGEVSVFQRPPVSQSSTNQERTRYLIGDPTGQSSARHEVDIQEFKTPNSRVAVAEKISIRPLGSKISAVPHSSSTLAGPRPSPRTTGAVITRPPVASKAASISSSSSSSSSSAVSRLNRPAGVVIAKTEIFTAPSDLQGTAQKTYTNAQGNDSRIYLSPPADPTGRQVDLADLMILCASSHTTASGSAELVVGCANHSVFAVDISDSRKRPTEMYGKKNGHTDWVSGVAHLADGRVVSCGMDSKICLWSRDKRTSVDIHAHSGSISKIATDKTYNLAVSCGYDRAISLWQFPEPRGRAAPVTGPMLTLRGHENPVLDFFFNDGILGSGARDGAIFFWDLQTGDLLTRHKAHAGPISVIDNVFEPSTGYSQFVSGGADGTVKLWDHREKKHVQANNIHGKAAVTAVISLGTNGLVSSGADNAIVHMDMRRGLSVIERYENARNSVYSLCSVGDGCVFAGDGSGMLYCYDLVGYSGEIGLKYGIGASEKGAVRCLLPVGQNSIVAAGEDGKILVFSY